MAQIRAKVDLALKLPQLQNMIKRDPESYKEEFDMQRRRYENELEIFKLRPTMDSERFTDLVTFMSHVIICAWKMSVLVVSFSQVSSWTMDCDSLGTSTVI